MSGEGCGDSLLREMIPEHMISLCALQVRMARPIDNPPNPWHSTHVEYLGDRPSAELKVYHERAKSILSKNESPDLPFRYSLNPYRGCFHACAYCYARPSHQYWDFGAGSDFERKLVAKVNAPEALEQTFNRPSWKGELIAFSGNTDCYQPLEASYELTRRSLEVCLRYRNPVGIITKGALIQRDVDVLAELSKVAHVHVNVSLAFIDPAVARGIEPSTPSPRKRLETIRVLSEAGINVGVGVAPIIPGLNEDQLVAIIEAARDAGATRAWYTLLRLPGPVEAVFVARLRESFPLRADKVLNALREMRGGQMNSSAFKERMRGKGPRWRATALLFEKTCERLGLEASEHPENYWSYESQGSTFRRPNAQLALGL